jgi:arylsulfatase A-like enzyme
VVFVSDHGDEFWEHGSIGHGHTVYEELLRVPLILRLRGVLPEGLTTDVPIDLADVAPSILDVLGIDPPPAAQGSSVLPYVVRAAHAAGSNEVLDAAPADRELFSAAQANAPKNSSRPRKSSLVYRNWKLIRTENAEGPATRELFDLSTDPEERIDIASAHPVVVGVLDQMRRWMRREYDARKRSTEDAVNERELEPDVEQNLRSLGYIE